jgi:ribosomal protein S18 acetylase RimI-like enzyme
MGNPRETGISSITGKVLYIRHANESERIDIAEILKKQTGRSLDVPEGDAVVASQEDRLLGFALLSKDTRHRAGCLSVYESRRHRGIGREVLRHLFEYSAVKYVAADRVAARHLLEIGFKRESTLARKDAGIPHNAYGGNRKASSFIFARASN